ncbi:MAG: hypothetical protein DRI94_09875 [Bacteroidetes bacterium]|nr:MAG: hypothetical protein DRI94_09875 [Bacteroidota bacterium]
MFSICQNPQGFYKSEKDLTGFENLSGLIQSRQPAGLPLRNLIKNKKYFSFTIDIFKIFRFFAKIFGLNIVILSLN